MAAMLVALQRLCRERPPRACFGGAGMHGRRGIHPHGLSHLAGTNHGADLAIVAEPTLLDLVHCHKGAMRWKIRTTRGRLPQLDARTGYQRDLPHEPGPRRPGRLCRRFWSAAAPDPIVGPPSLSVGRIEGGQSVNIVPDWCEIEIDRRLIPGEQPEQSAAAIRRFLVTGWEAWPTSSSTRPGSAFPPWFPASTHGSSRSRKPSGLRRRI